MDYYNTNDANPSIPKQPPFYGLSSSLSKANQIRPNGAFTISNKSLNLGKSDILHSKPYSNFPILSKKHEFLFSNPPKNQFLHLQPNPPKTHFDPINTQQKINVAPVKAAILFSCNAKLQMMKNLFGVLT